MNLVAPAPLLSPISIPPLRRNMMKLLTILALLSPALSFSPVASLRSSMSLYASPTVDQKQIGVLRPTGLFDPLDLMSQSDADFTRRRTSEIKHGRVAMVAVIGNLAPQLGLTFPGYISTSQGVKFSDVAEAGSFGALAKIPTFGVFQILLFAAIMEVRWVARARSRFSLFLTHLPLSSGLGSRRKAPPPATSEAVTGSATRTPLSRPRS